MHDINDRQYKYVFSHPIFVEKLLKSFIHEDFIKDLDFSSLDKVNKSFVDEDLGKYESDTIYKVYFKGKPIYIFILMEFQSKVDNLCQ